MTYLDSDAAHGGSGLGPSGVKIAEWSRARFQSVTVLTSRQREVLALTACGLRAKQVADRLGLSVRTIEKHKHDMMRKLGLRSTIELMRWYLDAHGRTPAGA